MIGVILAAGMAKRLRPLTDNCPKCLLQVGSKTLLQRTVDAMLSVGVESLVVVTGYKGDMIRSFITKMYPSVQVVFLDNTDYANNNNIFSLWMAGQEVRGKDFLLMDSDILCDPAVVAAVASKEQSSLAVNRHELGEEEMKVVVDEDMNIVEISKTCSPKDALGESVGIEKITADYSEALFRELDVMIKEEKLIDVFYEQAFQRLIAKDHSFVVVDTTNYFSYELDTPEDFEQASATIPQEFL